MKTFPIARILRLVRAFERGLDAADTTSPVAKTPADAKALAKQIQPLVDECTEWGFLLTADQFGRIRDVVVENPTNGTVLPLMTDALNRLEDECKRSVVMHIESKHSDYFNNPQFFDSQDVGSNKVSGQFPAAAEDIAEAGKCLACGRSTACVMHLSRIVEVGLRALANALGITPQNDWGRYLSEIDKELEKRFKGAGARTADEQFYSEAALTVDSVRRAWRNPTMHIEKTYTLERAEEILIAVRSFMRHLATKLHD